jgi:hypothetical protein
MIPMALIDELLFGHVFIRSNPPGGGSKKAQEQFPGPFRGNCSVSYRALPGILLVLVLLMLISNHPCGSGSHTGAHITHTSGAHSRSGWLGFRHKSFVMKQN